MKAFMLAMAFLAACTACGNSLESTDSLVFCNVDRTLFWKTATNNVFAVQSARTTYYTPEFVNVFGPKGISVQYEVAGSEAVVAVSRPNDSTSESLYRLQDENGVSVTLAVVKGSVAGNSAEIICRSSKSQWRTPCDKTVLLPIPYGATELRLDGAIVDTGLDGGAGWYEWTPSGDGPWTLSLTMNGATFLASVIREGMGFTLTFW